MILLSFYEELEQNFKDAGTKGRITKVDPSMQPTAKDIAELEQKIAIRVAENEKMLAQSQLYAKYYSLPTQ